MNIVVSGIDMRVILKRIFEFLGLLAIGGALFLEFLIFFSIITTGVFMAVEPNKLILVFEFYMAILGLIFYAYLWKAFFKEI